MTAKEKKLIRIEEKNEKIRDRKRIKRQRAKKRRRERNAYMKQHNKNEHHIIPTSRGGGRGENVCIIDINKHVDYHILFGNKTPDEIINYLIDNFWNGQTKWVFEAIAKRE